MPSAPGLQGAVGPSRAPILPVGNPVTSHTQVCFMRFPVSFLRPRPSSPARAECSPIPWLPRRAPHTQDSCWRQTFTHGDRARLQPRPAVPAVEPCRCLWLPAGWACLLQPSLQLLPAWPIQARWGWSWVRSFNFHTQKDGQGIFLNEINGFF